MAANWLIEGEGYILFITAYFIDHVLACAFLPSKQSPVIFNPSVTRSYPFTPSWGDKYWYLPVWITYSLDCVNVNYVMYGICMKVKFENKKVINSLLKAKFCLEQTNWSALPKDGTDRSVGKNLFSLDLDLHDLHENVFFLKGNF